MVKVPRGATLGEHLDGPSPPERQACVAANVRLCEAIRARGHVGSAALATSRLRRVGAEGGRER